MTDTSQAGSFAATEAPKPATADAATPAVCDVHGTEMIRTLEHIGDGKTKFSDPVCPYCQELAAKSAKTV